MGHNFLIIDRQGYRGGADVDWNGPEYMYPKQEPMKYVLRITLKESMPRVWREIRNRGTSSCFR